MARPVKNQMAMKQLHQHVKRLRRRKPCTAQDVQFWAYENLDHMELSPMSIHDAFNGKTDPSACSPKLLMALSGFFGVEPAELGPYAEKELNSALAYAGLFNGDDGDGQRKAQSRWSVFSPAGAFEPFAMEDAA